jgi:hypothetical protein
MRKIILFSILFFYFNLKSYNQNSKITSNENIGWYNYFGTFNISPKVSLHTEYQWRRDNYISNWQQSLLRFGVNYKFNPTILVRIGGAWIETFPYGDYTLQKFGKDFTEYRTYQLLQISNQFGKFNINHRYILEQRWVGNYNTEESLKEDFFTYLNRIRYMIKVNVPLNGTEIGDKTPYLSFFDEIFIGFGKNIQNNVFDQNRIGLLLGYSFTKNIILEAGYLNQTIFFVFRIYLQFIFIFN